MKHYFKFLGLLVIILFVLVGYLIVDKKNIEPKRCENGVLNQYKNEKFVAEKFYLNKEKFNLDVTKRLADVRAKHGDDFNLTGLLYDAGFMSGDYYYFMSDEQKKVINLQGENVAHEQEEPFAQNRRYISETDLINILSPKEAIDIAYPILNCFADYKDQIHREVYLYSNDDNEGVYWIITAKDATAITSGVNVRHQVTIDAFSGKIIKAD